MEIENYVIKGGAAGRERLRLLSQVYRPSTLALLEQAPVPPDARCLDVGSGGGDVTLELARRIAPRGWVVGVDLDAEKVEIARREAAALGVTNVEFRHGDAMEHLGDGEFDLVYARFLLSHLRDPLTCVRRMKAALKPGGILLVEDIDFAGHFWHPESWAMARYVQLFAAAVARRGGDATLGRKVPGLLLQAGLVRVGCRVVQPAGLDPAIKRLEAVTLDSIAEALLKEGLATPEEIERLSAELHAFAQDETTFGSAARTVQAWGYRDAGSPGHGDGS